MEALIIVEKAKEVFAVAEHAEGNVLLDGQEVFFAVAAEAPPGAPIQECANRRVVLTHISRQEDLEALQELGCSANASSRFSAWPARPGNNAPTSARRTWRCSWIATYGPSAPTFTGCSNEG